MSYTGSDEDYHTDRQVTDSPVCSLLQRPTSDFGPVAGRCCFWVSGASSTTKNISTKDWSLKPLLTTGTIARVFTPIIGIWAVSMKNTLIRLYQNSMISIETTIYSAYGRSVFGRFSD